MGYVHTVECELERAFKLFIEAEIDSPQLDAEVLMSYALARPRIYIISHPERQLTPEELSVYRNGVERRVNREPLPYITGEKEFWGLSFEVGPNVLVPRPETETLVEVALSCIDDPNALIADIGAGSGCIAVALAVELPDAVIYATELSHETAEMAHRNASRHEVQLRVDILEGNLLDPLPEEVKGKLDTVVSNPPYIPSHEIDELQPEVARYEPRGALDGGSDGMKYLRLILDTARDYLKPGGWVHMEMGFGQAAALIEYATSIGYVEAHTTKDLAGIERVLSAKKAE